MNKKGIVLGALLFILAVVGAISMVMILGIGTADTDPESQIPNISINLGEGFSADYDTPFFDVIYTSKDVEIGATLYSFQDYYELKDCSIEQFGEMCMQSISYDSASLSDIKTDGSLTYFEYKWTDGSAGETYCYYDYLYRTDEGFWWLTFSVNESLSQSYRQSISVWASSAKFEEIQ